MEHLLANLDALEISLTPEQVKSLESAVPFDAGFPSNMIVSLQYIQDIASNFCIQGDGTFYRPVWAASGHLDRQPLPQVIQPIGKNN